MTATGVYLRVSTPDQDVDNQTHALEPFCEARGFLPVRYYVDDGISTRDHRPAKQEILDHARQGRLSTIVVWKLDRFGRSVREIVNDLHELAAWGVEFVSFTEAGIDTTTPIGKGVVAVIAALAEMERENISERTRAAYARKKARAENLGQEVRWGRSKKDLDAEVLELVAAGELSQAEAARRLDVSRRTVRRRLREHEGGGQNGG